MTDELEDTFDYSQPHHIVVDCSTGIATPVLMTADEIAAHDARAAAWDADASARANAGIMQQIDSIEKSSGLPRALRDLMLVNTNAQAYPRVKGIDDQIAALRTQLVVAS